MGAGDTERNADRWLGNDAPAQGPEAAGASGEARQDAEDEATSGAADAASTRSAARHPWSAFYEAASASPSKPRGGEEEEDDSDDEAFQFGTGNNSGSRPGFRDSRQGFGDRRRQGYDHDRGGGYGGRRERAEWQEDEKVSHTVGRILRYHTASNGLNEDGEGFVALSGLLQVPDLQGITEENIRKIVESSVGPRGPRFEFRNDTADSENVEIRAMYRHDKERRPRREWGGQGGQGGQGGYERSGEREYSRASGDIFGGGHVDSGQQGTGYRCGRRGFHGTGTSGPVGARPQPSQLRPYSGFSSAPPDETSTTADTDTQVIAKDEKLSIAAVSAQEGEKQQSGDNDAGSTTPSSSSPAPGATEEPSEALEPEAEVWERYYDASNKAWFWNEATEEMFYPDDAKSGWEMFTGPTGKPWWWNEASGRYFLEEDDN